MSFTATYNAFQISSISKAEQHILSGICTFADRNGVCWPTVETIANRCRSSVRTVQTHINALVSKGLLQRIYRPNRPAITKVLIPLTHTLPAISAPLEVQFLHPEPDIQPVSIKTAAPEPATPEPGTDTATADIVFTENEQPITQALTQEMPDVLAIDSMVPVSKVTDCHPQMEMPVEACTAPVEPSQEVLATDPLADVPATLLQDLGEIRRNKKRPAKPTKTEAALWWQEAVKAGWTMEQVITTMILHGWARFDASWVQNLPAHVQPGAPGRDSVFVPETFTPASPSAIARFKESWAKQRAQILADSARRREEQMGRPARP